MAKKSRAGQGLGRLLAGIAALSAVGLLVSAGCEDDDPVVYPGTGGGSLADAGSISGLALINPTCGVGDGGTVSGDCVDCAQDHCSSDFADCFGADWQTDLRGGVCSDFGGCVMDCDCGDNQCFNVCLDALDQNAMDPCRSCIVDLVGCEQAHCAEECDSSEDPDAGEGGSHQGDGGPGG